MGLTLVCKCHCSCDSQQEMSTNVSKKSHSSHLLCLPQKSEAKLEEILKEIKSLKDLVSSQEKRIIKLEEQMSKIAI